MAGPLDLRGRVTVTDGATGTLNRIKASLDGVGASTRRVGSGQFLGNFGRSMALGAQKLQQSAMALSGAAAAVGLGFGGLISSTREFNESKFG